MNPIDVGAVVTWGSGRPRGKVTEVNADSARVKLLESQVGNCGTSFAAGLEAWFPLDELRLLA